MANKTPTIHLDVTVRYSENGCSYPSGSANYSVSVPEEFFSMGTLGKVVTGLIEDARIQFPDAVAQYEADQERYRLQREERERAEALAREEASRPA